MMKASNSELFIDGDIDLRGFLRLVWRDRFWVLLVLVVVAGLSAIYAYKVQQWWTAEALVEAPQVFDYEDYYIKIQHFKHVLHNQGVPGVKQGSEARDSTVPLDRYVEPAALLYQFTTSFNSASVQKDFLLQDEHFKSYLIAHDINDEKAVLRAVEQWSGGITVASLDKTDDKSLVSLKFVSTSAIQSVEQLQSYIDFVSKRTRDKVLRSVRTIKNTQYQKISHILHEREFRARKLIQLEIDRYTHAYNITVSANINSPLSDQSGASGEYFPVGLGSAAIKARIESLKSVKNLSVVDFSILEVKSNQEVLRGLDFGDDVDFHLFSYVDDIAAPLSQDGPTRALIIVLGVFFGGGVGIFLVFLRSFFRTEEFRPSQ